MRSFFAAAAIAFALLAGPAAEAAVLYDNTGPTSQSSFGGSLITPGYVIANSFTLSQDSTLTGVAYAGSSLEDAIAVSVDWAILDASPGASGTVLYSGAGALSNSLDAVSSPFRRYIYSFALPSLALDAGTYWLSLTNAAVDGGGNVVWGMSMGPSQAWSSDVGDLSRSHTFKINGTVSAVPEPGTWALMILGFGAVGAMARARRGRISLAA